MFKKRINKSDTIHQIYDNHKIKQQLIDYIFSMVDISKFKYKLLETQDDLQLLTTAKFHISGNYTGPNCLMVFTKNKDRYYSFMVDRKTLSYKQSQINIDNVVIYPIELGLDESIYDGTIIDGILSQTDDAKIYVITDLYFFRGDDMTSEKIKYKLINIKKYLDTYMNLDKNINNINVTVNNLYDISEIETLVNKTIPQTKQMQVRGIAFYPDISGTKLIYLFNKMQPGQHDPRQFGKPFSPRMPYQQNANVESQPYQQHKYGQSHEPQQAHRPIRSENTQYPNQRMDSKQQFASNPYAKQQFYQNANPVVTSQLSGERNSSPQDDVQVTTPKNKCRYISKTDEPVILTFEMRKTEQYDVYKLFLVTKCTEGGKTILKTKRFGIAYVPTIECSKMCKELTLTSGKALVKCKYDDVKEKWIPIGHDKTRKCPDYVTTLEEKMDIVMEED